jgi:WD40 repeat protein
MHSFSYWEYPPGRVLLPSPSGDYAVNYVPGDGSCREENDWVYLSQGEEFTELSASASSFSSYSFSGNERLLAITGDHWVRVWETESGQLLADIQGMNLTSVHFSADQRLLTAVDEGAVVHMWGVLE